MNAPVRMIDANYMLKSQIDGFMSKWREIVDNDGIVTAMTNFSSGFISRFGMNFSAKGSSTCGMMFLETQAGDICIYIRPLPDRHDTIICMTGIAMFIVKNCTLDGDLTPFTHGMHLVVGDTEQDCSDIWDSVPDCTCAA